MRDFSPIISAGRIIFGGKIIFQLFRRRIVTLKGCSQWVLEILLMLLDSTEKLWGIIHIHMFEISASTIIHPAERWHDHCCFCSKNLRRGSRWHDITFDRSLLSSVTKLGSAQASKWDHKTYPVYQTWRFRCSMRRGKGCKVSAGWSDHTVAGSTGCKITNLRTTEALVGRRHHSVRVKNAHVVRTGQCMTITNSQTSDRMFMRTVRTA